MRLAERTMRPSGVRSFGLREGRKPHILYIVTRAEHGGAQNHLLSLATSLRQDFEIAVAAGEEGFLTEECRARAIPAYVVPHLQRESSPFADTRALWELRTLIKRLGPDLIHAHTCKAGFLGRLAARSLGVPSVYTLHTWLFGTVALPAVWGLIGGPCERVAARWSARLITVSQDGADTARRHGIRPNSKVVTIYHGIKDCIERAELAADPPQVITSVARFCAPKDHEVLLRAFAATPPGPVLRLVGDGPLRQQVEQRARELGVYQRTEFLGDRPDVPSLLASSDMFVLASKYEMLPLSIAEAMRAGLPIVATGVGGVGEMIIDGETGLTVPPGSAALLAEAMNRLMHDRDLRRRLARGARQRFCEVFQYSRQMELTRALYWEVLAESGSMNAATVETARRAA